MQKKSWKLGVVVVFLATIVYGGVNFSSYCFAEDDGGVVSDICPGDKWIHTAIRIVKKSPKKKKRHACRKKRGFRREENVYVFGRNLKPGNADIYVVKNQKWKKDKSTFGPTNPGSPQDVTTNGAETVNVNARGRLRCTCVWKAHLDPGKFDVIVDTNQDGTFNDCDIIFKSSKGKGFKVRNDVH